ncbi:MAG: trypsin-like peptidase domain-containing protein [Kangiellaceae bacterium]|nr:trypsin-like peptidase domain-containing protein [Kangiellaceae bacterium]
MRVSQASSFSVAVEKAGPSVVSVQARLPGRRPRLARNGRQGDVLVDYPLNVGSGVIFDKDGYIITNYHVIMGSEKISVHFFNGMRKWAEIIGVDQQNDIAVLKVDIPTPNVAELALSENVKKGDIVLAIGTPFGLFENYVTSGIISSVDLGSLFPRIQTDAPINYGNSGGALINTLGQVIGISSSKFSVNRDSDTSISYGIPIDTVKEVFDVITGRVVRNWLGAGLHQLGRVLDSSIDSVVGLRVVSIEKGSPVEQAGILVGDYFVEFDGQEVINMVDFKRLFDSLPIGKEVEVVLLRNNEPISLKLQLKEKPIRKKI